MALRSVLATLVLAATAALVVGVAVERSTGEGNYHEAATAPAAAGEGSESESSESGGETADEHAHFHLKPLRVPVRADDVYGEARTMVEDLRGWSIVASDDERRVLTCARKGGLVSGSARITIACEGPAGIPSTTVRVRSESSGGLLSRDRANVLEFMVPFHRRVC